MVRKKKNKPKKSKLRYLIPIIIVLAIFIFSQTVLYTVVIHLRENSFVYGTISTIIIIALILWQKIKPKKLIEKLM